MRIEIGQYILNSDGSCYWIEEHYTTKGKSGSKGKASTRRITGYFTKFDQLMDDFLERKLRGAEIEDFKSACKVVQTALKDAKKIVREYKNV